LKEVADFSMSVQEYLNQAPTIHIRYLLSAPYYDYFRYQYLPSISKRIDMDDHMYSQTAVDIIEGQPLRYLQDVWMNFCALWQLYDLLTHQEKNFLRGFISSHPDSPYMAHPWYEKVNFTIVVWTIRIALLGICLGGLSMMLLSIIAAARRRFISPLVLVGATAALVTQSHFLLTAMSQAGLPRYSFALWPAIVLEGVIILRTCLNEFA